MEKRKRAALLLGEPDRLYQRDFTEGFLSYMAGADWDVCTFAMCQMYQNSAEREIGDSKIFSLIPYESFDAIVVMADTIQTPGVLSQIEAEIKNYFRGAVLFVDKESDLFPSIHMDDYGNSKLAVTHLIEHHGFRDIAYLAGKAWNDHAKQRLRGFRDCMAEHGIALREDRIFEGDFWYTSGGSMVDRLMKRADDLPQAIACANNQMAIGVAAALEKAGMKVPEDIAVVGLDFTREGMLTPVPLTTVRMPNVDLGTHAARSILALTEGKEIPEADFQGELFIGHSCGCRETLEAGSLLRRKTWDTPDATDGFDARYNTMMEDLMSQNRLGDFYNVVSSYVYQIEDADSFSLCLNPCWADEKELVDPENDFDAFADEMLLAVTYQAGSAEGAQKMRLDKTFSLAKLLPALDEEREKPAAYFFTPVFYEERIFGYAVLSYGEKTRGIGDIYPRWIANVMRGLECVRRAILADQAGKQIESGMYTDQKTGLLNYRGFMKKAEEMMGDCETLHVLAVDINGLTRINEAFGRDEGTKVIARVAKCVQECSHALITCCIGNDEFLLAAGDEKSRDNLREELLQKIDAWNAEKAPYQVALHRGEAHGELTGTEDLERIINEAVSQKNGNKALAHKSQKSLTFTEEERKVMDLVDDMLQKNLLTYHFQPIINAKTGDIYSYEALMRSDTSQRIPPLDILKYAEALEKLDEVEKRTYLNIISFIQAHQEAFDGKKVFINSIPGVKLSEEDAAYVSRQFKEQEGQIVIELTEQAELKDDELARIKQEYEELGVEMAVDDYGTGYSNVTNLLRYMPRYVKIDRMLLSEIQNSPQKQHFVNEIIEFAHNNNILALAEGVETAEELEMVIQLGADLIQGYYVARPSAEVLQQIPVKVKREIHQFNVQRQYNKNQSIYVAGREFRISLAKLISEEYECIMVPSENSTYRDLSIVGVPGTKSNIVVDIADGYRGRVQIENASFAGKRGLPCITIGEDCDVTLVLSGDNELRTGGICVPQSSKLTVEGEGNLNIDCNFDNYFGIGNAMNEKHGDLFFEHKGLIEILCNGTLGVAVGSGQGGVIRILSGKMQITTTGKEGVAIGAVKGETDVEIATCDVFMNCSVYDGVAIGSMEGRCVCRTRHIAINGRLSGTNLIGIGSLKNPGDDNEIDLQNCNVTFTIFGTKITSLGCMQGRSDISIQYAALNLETVADINLIVGDEDRRSTLLIGNGEINMDVTSRKEERFGVAEENIRLENGRINRIDSGKHRA